MKCSGCNDEIIRYTLPIDSELFDPSFRDALESGTRLYNQVEEKLHTLVMKSNESLQHLELLFKLREMEARISKVRCLIEMNVLLMNHIYNMVLLIDCQVINHYYIIFHDILQAGMWFNADGEQSLKESYITDGTLVCTEKAMQHLDLFLTQSKVLQKSYKCLFKARTISLI